MNIRLSPHDTQAIVECFRLLFLQGDHLWLFGSRVDLSARGGDIDLYIETDLAIKPAVESKIRFITMLYDKIGEQKIDVVLNCKQVGNPLAIYSIARNQGVLLY